MLSKFDVKMYRLISKKNFLNKNTIFKSGLNPDHVMDPRYGSIIFKSEPVNDSEPVNYGKSRMGF